MVRNLMTVNRALCRPTRVWRKNTGPGELSLTPRATTASSGAVSSRTRELMQMSKRRFMNWSHTLRCGRAISRKGSPLRSLSRDRQLTSSKYWGTMAMCTDSCSFR